MFIKGIVDEDFVNYKRPSMFITTSTCDFKCDRECGMHVCQNSELAHAATLYINDKDIAQRFISNPITKAIVFGGLEPMDSFDDIYALVDWLNILHDHSDVVIYTGYTEEEVADAIDCLYELSRPYRDLIVKYGRFKPDGCRKIDPILGVYLASDNQYAVCYPQQIDF